MKMLNHFVIGKLCMNFRSGVLFVFCMGGVFSGGTLFGAQGSAERAWSQMAKSFEKKICTNYMILQLASGQKMKINDLWTFVQKAENNTENTVKGFIGKSDTGELVLVAGNPKIPRSCKPVVGFITEGEWSPVRYLWVGAFLGAIVSTLSWHVAGRWHRK